MIIRCVWWHFRGTEDKGLSVSSEESGSLLEIFAEERQNAVFAVFVVGLEGNTDREGRREREEGRPEMSVIWKKF